MSLFLCALERVMGGRYCRVVLDNVDRMFSLSNDGVDDDNDNGLFIVHRGGRRWGAFAPPLRRKVALLQGGRSI